MATIAEELDLLTLKQASDLSGFHVDTIRRWIRLEYLTPHGSPGRRMVDRAELVEFIRVGPSRPPRRS